jgi:nicotinamide riboside kinase
MAEKSPHILRIAVTGPECTGKTYVCQALATHFGGAWVPEYAREYLENLGRKYTYDDLGVIAHGHLEQEKRITRSAAEKNLPVVLTDTELINIKIWSEFWYKRSEAWIAEEIRKADHDHYFLMYPDIAWAPDPLRENPTGREFLFNCFLKELQDFGKSFSIIRGSYENRVQEAIRQVNGLLR